MTLADSDMWTVRKVMAWSSHFLADKGSPTARLDAELLLADALQCSRIDLYTGIDKPLAREERAVYRDYIKRRGTGEPVAYILGHKGFWKHDFIVNPYTLIPRNDTELLIEVVLNELSQREKSVGTLLDIGTGSGCIALSLAKELPEFSIEAWDVEEKTLATAQANAAALDIDNIDFKIQDALDYRIWEEGPLFDIIVSNPPYIRRDEEESLPKSVIGFEPALALFADGNGLEFYEAFAAMAKQRLTPGGILAVEVGLGQADQVGSLFALEGWTLKGFHKDLASIDRVVVVSPPDGSR